MTVAARLNMVLCATIGLGIAAFAMADEAWGLVLLGIGGAFVGYVSGRPDPRRPTPGPWTLPRFSVNILVFLAIVNAALQATVFRDSQTPLVSNLGAFLTHVQLIKLLDRRSSRDEAQLLGLSLFVVIAAILTSNSLLVGVALALYTPLVVSAAMLTEIGSGRTGSATQAPVFPRALFAQLRRVVGVCVVSACLLAAAVFIVTPRGLGNDILGAFGRTRGAQIGFTDQVRLGVDGVLSESPTPVLDLAIFDEDGRNVGGATRSVYLRGAVRDLYTRRGRWETRDRLDAHPTPLDINDRHTLGAAPSGAPLLTQRIVPRGRRRDGEDYVFHVWRPVSVTFSSPTRINVAHRDVIMTLTSTTGQPSNRAGYTVVSVPGDMQAGGDEPSVPDTFREGPIAELARGIIAEDDGRGRRGAAEDAPPREGVELADAMRRRRDAARIRDHLQREYAYTLEMVAPRENQDPIEMFLFETRRGHCEYFASAMVAMCQSVGIPARLALGYVAVEYSGLTGQYTVRESNAHAWVEVCLGPGRWATMDPSPPADIERIHKPAAGPLSRLRALYDLLEFNWNQAVVGFDRSSQSRLLRPYSEGSNWVAGAMETLTSATRQVRRALGLAGDSQLRSDMLMVALWWLSLATFICLVAWMVWRKRRSLFFRRMAHSEVDRELRALLAQARFYPRALRALRRAGLGKPSGRGAREHAARLARGAPEAAAAFDVVADLYYQLRFARRGLSDAEAARAEAALRALERARARAAARPAQAASPVGGAA